MASATPVEDDRRPLVDEEEEGSTSQALSETRSQGLGEAAQPGEIELRVVDAAGVGEECAETQVQLLPAGLGGASRRIALRADATDGPDALQHSRAASRSRRPRWLPSRLFNTPLDCSWWEPSAATPPFYAIDSTPPWTLSVFMGLQHALAMAAGIVSIPIVISGADAFQLPTPDTQYLISVGLLLSGLSSLIQVHRFELPAGKFLGTGMISISGTSFTFVPIAQAAAKLIMQEDSMDACAQDSDCLLPWADSAGAAIPGVSNIGQCNLTSGRCRRAGGDALGAFLGTSMVCCFLQIALSLVPARVLRSAFPSCVTGVCVTLIGAGLTGTAFKYWFGGPACSTSSSSRIVPVHRGADCSHEQCAARTYPSHSPCMQDRAGSVAAWTPVEEGEGPWQVCEGYGGALKTTCRYKSAWYDAAARLTRGDVTECLLTKANAASGALPAATNPSPPGGELGTRIELGVRVDYLVSRMRASALKQQLQGCLREDRRMRPAALAIGHRGACLQFPEHTAESYRAAALQGAATIECDVAVTADGELVCRHSQCDLHTSTDILLLPSLAAKCSQSWRPYDATTGELATARCCTSDITLSEFKQLCGKMDGVNVKARTPAEYVAGM